MSASVIPGIGTLNSSALTTQQVSVIFQNILLQVLGVVPASPDDAEAYAKVRVGWQGAGQPDWARTDDVAFVLAWETPMSGQAFEVQAVDTDDDSYDEATVFTRVWQVKFTFYGPNSFDRARLSKSCIYQDFVHDILAASNLYLVNDVGTPQRAPELFTGDYWERTDISFRFNEKVTETLNKPSMASVEVIIEDADGIVGDFTVSLE